MSATDPAPGSARERAETTAPSRRATPQAEREPHRYPGRRLVVMGPRRGVPPATVPRVPGMELAVRYEPALEHAEVGGDFYEVLPVGDRVLVGIGDVVGHSAHAAAVMAELVSGLRALVGEGHGLPAILRRLNGALLRSRPEHTATVCLMLLDPVTGALEVANAGHPPPLISADGGGRYLGHGGVLLGVAGAGASVEKLVLPAGGAAVLFTDGLVERRGVPIDRGLTRLRRICASVDGDLEELCDRILAAFGPREDDVALVILRRR